MRKTPDLAVTDVFLIFKLGSVGQQFVLVFADQQHIFGLEPRRRRIPRVQLAGHYSSGARRIDPHLSGLETAEAARTLCVTINPVSAYGWKFDKDEFMARMKEAVDVPVINVKEELA